MTRLNKIFIFSFAIIFLSCCFSCKKAAKEAVEGISEKSIAKKVSKETSEDVIEKIGKKELKVLEWSDLLKVISQKRPMLGEALERLDGTVQKALSKAVNKDYKFFKALTSSNSIIDECEVYSKDAPNLMKDANFMRMFIKSDIVRKEGRQCLWDNLTAKEEKGLIRFYEKNSNKKVADYKDGVINVFNPSILSQELIPNACYTIKNETGKKCTYLVDDLGRIYSVEAKNMSPDEIMSDIINRTGNNDFGREWDNAFKKLKQSSKTGDVDIRCKFNFVNDEELTPNYVHIDAEIRGKKQISSSYKNSAKRVGNSFSAEENATILAKYAPKVNISPEKLQKLLQEMNADDGLANLIHEAPEFNIMRWSNTRNHVNQKLIKRTPKGKYPPNARVYSGNVYYFNPHLNYGLKARLKRGNGFAVLKTKSPLSYDDLVKLDNMYPEGVPFTKEGFPDFSKVAAKGKDGKPIKVNIGRLSGDSKKDVNAAETIFQNMGNTWEDGFTWHHIENTTELLRVPTSIHQLVDHAGAMSMSGLK